MRVRQISSAPRERTEQSKRTVLGICHTCARIVYAGDSLAIARGHLLHGDCPPDSATPPTAA